MGVSISSSGSFDKTMRFLQNVRKATDVKPILDQMGRQGVAALSAATPTDTGLAASSWDYIVEVSGGKSTLTFTNSAKAGNSNTPVVILLQYGHATRNGGYVQGRDFINPAITPIFDKIAKEAWKKVKSV